jgi:D-serine deaminase-like pyridoxal phosphate-dependent protein
LDEFGCALSVLATVVSRPSDNRAIVDMGNKAIALRQGLAQPNGLEGVELVILNEEHGHLTLKGPGKEIKVGDRIEFIPSHCCGTVDLHERYYGIRNGQLGTRL